MAKKPVSTPAAGPSAADILSYRHPDRRMNNPEVGMVPDDGKTRWAHDPQLDPGLSWTGKAERTSFEVDTVSLHVHERIDPASILSALMKQLSNKAVEQKTLSSPLLMVARQRTKPKAPKPRNL
jgi:adenine-specific DNA-methyltransferase